MVQLTVSKFDFFYRGISIHMCERLVDLKITSMHSLRVCPQKTFRCECERNPFYLSISHSEGRIMVIYDSMSCSVASPNKVNKTAHSKKTEINLLNE